MAPPISPYIRPGWSPPFCPVPLELRSGFYVLLCDIPPIFLAIIWSVSLTPACPLRVTPLLGCSLDTCVACGWLDFLSSSSLFRDSVICATLWSRQLGPDASCNRHGVALALSPSVTVVLIPCYCGMLGGLHSALRLGCLHAPSYHFQDSVSCLTCSLDSQLLRLPAIRQCGVGPVFLAVGCYGPLAIAVRLVVFTSWLAPSLIPHWDVCLSLPTLGACCA